MKHGKPANSRLLGRVAIGVTALVAAAGGAFAITEYATGNSDGEAADRAAQVVTVDGTTLDGAQINGGLHIKANNVRVVNATIRHSGDSAIEISPGFQGTVIERTEVICEAAGTDGVAFGNYTARQVTVRGCRVGFQHSAMAPVAITDSTWNDKPVTVDYTFVQPDKPRPSPGAGLTPGPIAAAAGGKSWPGPHNTGVPRGTELTTYTGDFDITEAGTVIDRKDIKGCIGIKAQNVVIKRSRISCKIEGGMIIRVYDNVPGGASVTVEDSEIEGQGEGLGIGFGHYTLRRVNMHTMNEGIRVSDEAIVEDCWIHNLVFTDEKDHQDILQTTGGKDMVIRNNTLESFSPTANEPFNAAFQLGSETAPSVTNLLVEGNLMTGGNYTVNFRPDMVAVNVVFRDNVFVRNARYGPAAREDLSGVTWADSNVWADTGRPITEPAK